MRSFLLLFILATAPALAQSGTATTQSDPQKERREFVNHLAQFKGRIYVIGHGAKSQIAEDEIPSALRKADQIVERLNLRHGVGRWVVESGGDEANPAKPDIGVILNYFSEKHGIPVVAVAPHIVKEWGGVPKYVSRVLYVPTVYNGKEIVWGGTVQGKPVGPTEVFLGPNSLTTEIISFGGGPIALEEVLYNQSQKKLELTYVRTKARFPEANGPYGSIENSQCRIPHLL